MEGVTRELLPTNVDLKKIGRPLNDLTGKPFESLQEDFPIPGKKRVRSAKKHLEQMHDVVSRFETSGKLKTEDGTEILAIATTYDQTQGSSGERRQEFFNRIVKTGKAFIVMDEAHEAAGTEQARKANQAAIDRERKKEEAGLASKKVARHRSLWAIQLVNMEELAGVVFSSATFAKSADALPLFMRAGLGNFEVGQRLAIAQRIANGGLQMMSAFAQMLAEGGYYMRRQKSFEGIKFETTSVEVAEENQDQLADFLSRTFAFAKNQDLQQLFHEIGDEIRGNFMRGGMGAASSMRVESASDLYTNVMYNAAARVATAHKAVNVAQTIVDAVLKNNEQVLIGADLTNEAGLERHMERNKIKPGEWFTFSQADMLSVDVEGMRYASFNNPITNEKVRAYIEDERLDGIGLLDEYNKMQADIAESPEMEALRQLPGMPIDYILSKLNENGIATGEITGRNWVVEMDTKNPTRIRVRKRTDAERNRGTNINDFNNGRTRAVFVNVAGATGSSLHARRGVDERVRHMFIVQPLMDINAFIQILGRINRFGQTVLPKYTLVGSNIPFDTKVISAMVRKLKSLNASSTAESKSAIEFDALDLQHLIGDMAAQEWQEQNQEISDQLQLKRLPKPTLTRAATAGQNVNDVLNKMIMLPREEQMRILDSMEERVSEIMDGFSRQGINPLASPVKDLQFRVLAEMEVLPPSGSGTFEGPLYISQVEANVLTKPPSVDSIVEELTGIHGERDNPVVLGKGGFAEESKEAHQELLTYRSNLYKEFNERKSQLDKINEQIKEIEQQDIVTREYVRLENLEGAKKTLERQINRFNYLIKKVDGWQSILVQYRDGIINRAFALNRGMEKGDLENPAGYAIITDFTVKTTDPTDPLFLSETNVKISVAGDELGIGSFSMASLHAIQETVNNEVDLSLGYAQAWNSEEFVDAMTAGRDAKREIMLVARGNLIRAMTEVKNKYATKGQIIFATTIEGNTERVIDLRDSLAGDFSLANIRFVPKQVAKYLVDGVHSDFRITYVIQAKAKGAPAKEEVVAQTNTTAEDVVFEINTSRRIDPILQLAKDLKITTESPSSNRTVFRIPKKGGLDKTTRMASVISQTMVEDWSVNKVEEFAKATGRSTELTASDGVIVDPALQGDFAKKQNRIRKRRQNSNRRGFAYVPGFRDPRIKTKGKGVPTKATAGIMPGFFLEHVTFGNNSIYGKVLQRLREAYDIYTKKIDDHLKRDSKVWRKMPRSWRVDNEHRFMRIMDFPFEPWIINKPKLSTKAMNARGWSKEYQQAYNWLMDAPDSVKDAFVYFRYRDEYMRKQMARAIQKQKYAKFIQFTNKEMVALANSPDVALNWTLGKKADSKKGGIYDRFGRRLTKHEAASRLVRAELPTAGFGYRYEHVFHAWTGGFSIKIWDNTEKKYVLLEQPGDYSFENSAKTEGEAYSIARKYLKAHPKAKILIEPIVTYPGDIQRLTSQQVNDIKAHLKSYAEASGAAVSAALSGKIGKMKYRSKFYAPFLKRQGVTGYSKNYVEVWGASVVGFERWFELTNANREVMDAIESMQDRRAKTDLQSRLEFLWNGRQPMVGITETIDAVVDKGAALLTGGSVKPGLFSRSLDFYRSASYFLNLAWPGNVVGAAVNATQIPAVTAAMIGYGRTAAATYEILSNPSRSMQILEQYGRFTGRGKWDDGTLPVVSGARKAMNVINEISPFTQVEKINQNGAFLIGFYDGIRRGYSEQAAADYANRLRLMTQFSYNAAEVQTIYRSKLGMTAFQFKRFSLNWMALLAVSAKTNKLAAIRMLLATMTFGGINAIMPRTVQGFVIRAAGAKTLSGVIGSMLMALGLDDPEDEEKVEKIANALTYGITAGIANGEFNVSDRFSPYPIRMPYGDKTAEEAVGSILFETLFGVTGTTGVRAVDEFFDERSTIPAVDRWMNLTTAGRQINQFRQYLDNDMARRAGSGNKMFSQTDLSMIARTIGFQDTKLLETSAFVNSMNAAQEAQSELVNNVAKHRLAAIKNAMEGRFDQANIEMAKGQQIMARSLQENLGFIVDEQMVARRMENMIKSREIGLLFREAERKNDKSFVAWLASMNPYERVTFLKLMQAEIKGMGR